LFYMNGKKSNFKTFNQEMGYKEEMKHFKEVLTGVTTPLLKAEEIFSSTRTVFAVNKSLGTGDSIIVSKGWE